MSGGNPHVVTTVHCAGPNCQAVRKEANHWFVVEIEEHRFMCLPYKKGWLLQPIDKPVCGQACAQKLFEKWLATAGT